LLSIPQLCTNGCKAELDNEAIRIMRDDQIVLAGTRCLDTGLWHIDVTNPIPKTDSEEIDTLVSKTATPSGPTPFSANVFAYIKQHNRSRLVMDDSHLAIDQTAFTTVNWEAFYPGAKEAIPPNIPEALGKAVATTCYVDADHAGCLATRRSHTGVLLYVNSALVLWHSKRQNTVEASTFGSEFIAAKTAVEMVEGLRMMGFPLLGPTSVFCDNQSVVTNASQPESTLSKKHNSIAYHRVCEA
jgi:hypothetical protein